MGVVFELSEDQRLVEHLIDYSISLGEAPWSYEGEVLGEKRGRRVASAGRVTWVEHRGEAMLTGPFGAGSYLMSNGLYGRFIPDDEYVYLFAPDNSWLATRAYVTETRYDDALERMTLRLFDLATGRTDVTTPSQGIVLGGVDLADWPHAFPTNMERTRGSVDGMITSIFGRMTLMRRMGSSSEAGRDVLVAFDGEPLDMLERSALWLLMSFLAGRFGSVVGEIGIDGSLEVWRRRFRWTARSQAARPPLDMHRWNVGAFELPARFPGMLDRTLALLREQIPIDVALTHLFADSRGHLDVEIRDIALALDVLIEANAFAAKGTYVIDPNRYAELLPGLTRAISEVVASEDQAEALTARLAERLKGANDVSHAERRRKFFERLGFDLKADEKDALDNRHPMSHAGYVLRGANSEEYQALSDQVHLARNLVNRAILALLGYDGPLFDYQTGRVQPWNYFIERDGSRKKASSAP